MSLLIPYVERQIGCNYSEMEKNQKFVPLLIKENQLNFFLTIPVPC
jgi:hypothetical protein